MKIFGKLCNRIDTKEGKEKFIHFYNIDPYQYIFEYELFNVNRIFPNKFKYIAFLESDSEPRQVFVLEKEEHLMVYNDIESEIFNTDSMAFFSLIRECKRIGTFCTEHSPYSFSLDNQECLDSECFNSEEIIQNITDFCSSDSSDEVPNMNNVLVVRAL